MTEKLNQIEALLKCIVDNTKSPYANAADANTAINIIQQLKVDLKSELTDEMIADEAKKLFPDALFGDNPLRCKYWTKGAKFARDFRPKDNDAIKFAEWLPMNAFVAEDEYYYTSMETGQAITVKELYELFLTQNR